MARFIIETYDSSKIFSTSVIDFDRKIYNLEGTSEVNTNAWVMLQRMQDLLPMYLKKAGSLKNARVGHIEKLKKNHDGVFYTYRSVYVFTYYGDMEWLYVFAKNPELMEAWLLGEPLVEINAQRRLAAIGHTTFVRIKDMANFLDEIGAQSCTKKYPTNNVDDLCVYHDRVKYGLMKQSTYNALANKIEHLKDVMDALITKYSK